MIWEIFKTISWLAALAWAVWMVVRMVRDEEDKDERTSWAIFFLLGLMLAVPIYFFCRYLPMKWRKENAEKRESKNSHSAV